MSALRECPFCGGDAVVKTRHTQLPVTVFVMCPRCYASVSRTQENAAIAAWNRRAPGPGYAAGAEAMREAAALNIDCGCQERAAVLAAKPGAERWRACGRDPCGALEAAAIRALPIPEAKEEPK